MPFYGGEAFGLHAIGQEALKEHSVSLVALADVVRGGPELEMFLIGLLLVAVAAIMAAVAIWRSALLNRWSGLPFAIAWALFIPQFTAGQPLRVAHGLVLTIGCIWIAVEMWRSLPLSAERTVAPTAKASRSR